MWTGSGGAEVREGAGSGGARVRERVGSGGWAMQVEGR